MLLFHLIIRFFSYSFIVVYRCRHDDCPAKVVVRAYQASGKLFYKVKETKHNYVNDKDDDPIIIRYRLSLSNSDDVALQHNHGINIDQISVSNGRRISSTYDLSKYHFFTIQPCIYSHSILNFFYAKSLYVSLIEPEERQFLEDNANLSTALCHTQFVKVFKDVFISKSVIETVRKGWRGK